MKKTIAGRAPIANPPNRKPTARLALRRELVRVLSAPELETVGGAEGGTNQETNSSGLCGSKGCGL